MTRHFDVIVVGGGLVGAAIAFGLRDLGSKLAVFDEGDVAYRAARGNFGLIWVQGKGLGLPPYGTWTQRAARAWPRFAALLHDETGIDVALRQAGGVHVCLSQRELEVRSEHFAQLFAQPGFERYAIEILDHAGVARRVPGIGPDVVGGTWSALDGDCNPLRLLRALDIGLERAGVARLSRSGVMAIEPRADRFGVRTAQAEFTCERIVLAAGLGNARLAPMVGLAAPVLPNQGQILVLERVPPFLSMPLETIRQTDEGTVLLGDSQQDRGFDEAVDPAVLAAIAARAVRVFPALRDVRVVRTWAALRVMSPDGFPIYAQSRAHPGAFLTTCHSGVTLAAAHALDLAPAIRTGALTAEYHPYALERFDVRAAA
jgi:hydrogen cyanide synthase HcnC